MCLTKVHMTEFQSIRDSNEFSVGDITCLVGKNEAGKTALLQALYRLKPIISADAKYRVTDDYPRWDVEDYRFEVESGEREHTPVATAVFELDDPDAAAAEEIFGSAALSKRCFKVCKGYKNQLCFEMSVDQPAALRHLVDAREFTPETQAKLEACDTVEKMVTALGIMYP